MRQRTAVRWRGTLSSQHDLKADLQRRLDSAAAGIISDLAGHGVIGVVGSVSFDLHPVVHLQTATDAQRDRLPLVGCQEVVARRLADQGVAGMTVALIDAQSEETVEREFCGDWTLVAR